ncbi:polymer-forming cytoskeletal protein [Paenibacillus faecis]|uniref:Polymer-forming cytoskeletal protein n=1 Tax=Paenibacillus faecis TaxID=862114 RepID=A0A5D0CYY8_9BACL|nr:polymer-forming cytoskeletal protein [Paenibacillus faecis]TYA15251.1 polymer-forming cytoskeletal protein [Paenibacillus faecis]
MLKKNNTITGGTDTLIGKGSSAEGKLECQTNLRIEGKFYGDIECGGQVVIGETGEALSNIKGSDIVVAGKVIGDITSQGRLTITGSGQVEGTVNVAKLVIVEGGLLNGSAQMEKTSPSVLSVKEKSSKKAAQPEAG